MEKQQIQRLRDLPIEQVALRLGLQVTRHKSLCPFHDDHHASLSFNTRHNTCRCFVCMDSSINTIDLVMRHLHVDFPKACQWLADENNIILEQWKPSDLRTPHPTVNQPKPFDAPRYMRFFEHPWLSPEARRFLFDERHIDPRVAAWCRLTSWTDRHGTHWLQTPYFDQHGKLIGVQNRNLDHRKDGKMKKLKDEKMKKLKDEKMKKLKDGKMEQARFRFPYGARCSIYNLPVLARLREGDDLYITEGCSDCWAMLSSGRKAIAIPSATLLQPADRQLLTDIDKRLHLSWHMFPDRDAPGERLFLQLQQLLPNIQHHQLPNGCKDFAEMYVKGIKQ